nr:myb-like protein Q [Bactrocera oleae]
MLLVALLFASSPIDGAKNGKSKGTNTTLTTTTADVESKTVLTDNVSSDRIINNATKINEKASYPKKVHSLKKRPTKTPTSYVTASATQNSKNKRKKVTDVTAAFKDLPADDLEFINELDKQFQLHGEKIKIKVEHDNSTESEKQNSKRTIDGELGYGAYHAHNGYQYERPKFMFYPYSQQNIPVDAPGYYPPKTDVSIEPSYSYELQSQSYVQKHGAQQPPEVLDVPKHGAQGGYEEPVIVLRIPGPTKYASHLQTLLQQYLEIRAAQYLRILQENELHKQHQQHTHQHLEQQQQQQEHLLQQEHILQQQQQQHAQQQQHEQQAQLYEQQALIQHGGVPAQQYAEPTLQLQPPAHEQHVAQHAPAVNEEHGYSPEVTYAHQIAPTPQAVVYSDVDEIYQGYKGKLHAPQAALQQQQHHEQQQQVEYVQQQHEEALEPQQLQHGQQYFLKAAPPSAIQQYYYTPGTQFGPHGSHHYQNVYFMAIAPQSGYTTHAAHAAALQHQPIYVQEEEQEQELQQQHHQHQQAQHELAATAHGENNPRQTHTKVIYTQNSEKGAADFTGSYALPSVRPYERHAAASAPAYQHQQQLQEQLLHEHQQQQQHEQLEQQQQFDYDAPLPLAASEQEHAHQRSAAIKPEPFNYHAHGAKALRRVNRKRGAPALKSTTAVTTDVQVDEHLQKIRKFVRENLGAQMSTAVEFKTTALVKS